MSEIENLANSGSAVDAVSDVFGAGAGALGLVPGGAMIGAGVAAAGAAANAGGGGQWSFDKEQINSLITKWKQLKDECTKDGDDLRALGTVVLQMSEDQPSAEYSSTVLKGVAAMSQTNTSMLQYIEDFIDKLENARDGIQSQEDANSGSMKA